MYTSLNNFLKRCKANGSLAIIANLLFDVVLVGWITFTGLVAMEILLPTFVSARLSLVKFSLLLLILTALLVWLGRLLGRTENALEKSNYRPLLTLCGIVGLGILTFAQYRFPGWSIPIILGGYLSIGWLFFTLFRHTR